MQTPSQSELLAEALRYQSALTAYAYGMLLDWSLAKDAVQDAFVVLVEKYADCDPSAGVFPLAKKIVRLKVFEILRKRRKEILMEDEELIRIVGDTLDHEFGEDDARQHNLRLGALQECMTQLSESMKKLVVSFYWKHQSCETIARVMGRNAPSLRVMLMRVRGKLHECMDARLQPPEVLS